MAVSDDLVEDALFGDQVSLLLGDKGPGFAQLDGVPNLSISLVLDGQRVDRFFKGFDNRFSGR